MNALGLFLLWLGYTIVSIGMWRLVPTIAGWDVVSYADLATTTESLVQNLTIAQGIITGLVVLLVIVLGWKTAVLKDNKPIPRWLLAVPIIVVVVALATTDWSNLADKGGSYVLALAVTTPFIGISEETMFRGVGSLLGSAAWADRDGRLVLVIAGVCVHPCGQCVRR